MRASGEATPHHLVLTDEAVRSLDSNFKMNPPLRSADDRKALVDAVRDGTITVIATDHAPHALHEKDVPFEEAPFGVTGLETAFAVAEHAPGRAGAAHAGDAARADVRRAGARLRTRGAGGSRSGARANLVLLDPEAVWRVGDGGFRSRSGNSWLLGETLKGKVRLTVAAGRVAYEGV